MPEPFVVIENLTHVYPASRKHRQPRTALASLNLAIPQGELFAILGPNGSGKSTLFRILSTIVRATAGEALIMGANLRTEAHVVRRCMGVVFQHPSLDDKLTVEENLFHQGHLYGLQGDGLAKRIDESLELVGISDRRDEPAEHLSGGMKRRVELAKSLLHKPPLLLLDEPSTGLNPGARKEFIGYLERLRSEEGVTVLLTTHILDEADRCDRLAILEEGNLVALGSPADLKRTIGGDVITLTSDNAETLGSDISAQFGVPVRTIGNTVRIEKEHGHAVIPQYIEAFPGRIDSVTVAKPNLEDVFIHLTGHQFRDRSEGRADD